MSDDVRHLIARRIREEMERQGKRQWQLSAALELDQSSTSLRVQGRRSFRAEELVRVARWLQVPIASLVGETRGRAA